MNDYYESSSHAIFVNCIEMVFLLVCQWSSVAVLAMDVNILHNHRHKQTHTPECRKDEEK